MEYERLPYPELRTSCIFHVNEATEKFFGMYSFILRWDTDPSQRVVATYTTNGNTVERIEYRGDKENRRTFEGIEQPNDLRMLIVHQIEKVVKELKRHTSSFNTQTLRCIEGSAQR